MSFSTERHSDGTIIISPKNEAEQSGLVVICHGLGDTAEGFADVAELFAQRLPHVKFILPTAPRQPVTMNMGMAMPSWYDIVGLDERANESCHGIDVSRERITRILQDEHESTGLPYERMVLTGFSQGGALSLFTGLQLTAEQRLAGIVVMSGYLPAASQFKVTPGLEDVPVLHCHGTQDMVVNYALATKTKHAVTAKGLKDYTIRSYPLGHSVNMDELNDVGQFLEKILPPDDSCRVKLKDPADMTVKELKALIRKAGLQSKALGFTEKSEFIQLVRDYRDGK